MLCYLPMRSLCDVRYRPSICCYLAMHCPVLTWRYLLLLRYAMSGTDLAYGATSAGGARQLAGVLGSCTALEVGYYAIGLHHEIRCKKPHMQYNLYQECGFLYLILQCTQCAVLARQQYYLAMLSAYAMRGTDIAHFVIGLCGSHNANSCPPAKSRARNHPPAQILGR
eukprot:3224545-Rhodomonas_salina.1